MGSSKWRINSDICHTFRVDVTYVRRRAVVGGVNLILHPDTCAMFQKAGV